MPERRAAVVYDCLFPLSVGGGERVYRRIAEVLVERGFVTDYVTRRVWDGDPPEASFRPVGVWAGEIYDPEGVRRTTAALAFAGRVLRHFLGRRRKYDIVMASALPPLTALAVRIALLGSGTRVVADWLEVWPAAKWRAYAGGLSGSLAAWLQALAIRVIGEHTANSAFTASRLRSIGPRARVTVLGLVDLVEERHAERAAVPPTALFVGRLIADKRPLLVPEIIRRARVAVPDLRAVMVGDGPLRAELDELAAVDADRAVEVLGRISDAELDPWRSRAAVLLAPSVREGFGLAVAESAAAGVPVVAVRHPDNAAVDLVEPGINGDLAEADDVADIADAIVRVVRAGAPLRVTTLEWFHSARRAHSLAASIDELLGSR
jgi:glycosyltransferase involved in cell wall biosynthesis